MPGLTSVIALASAGLGGILADGVRPYIYQGAGADALADVPGIRVHTAIEAMMWALEKFSSMLDVNIVAGQHAAWPGAFAGMVARTHYRHAR